MYRIIACDLDETLLQTWDKKVSEENKKAIAAASAQGVKFVVGTGRPFSSVQGTLEELGLKGKKDEYVISLNGGAISENYENKVMYCHGINFDEACAFFERAKGYDVGVHVYTIDKVYVWKLDLMGERKFLKGRMPVIEREDENLDFLAGEDIIKVLFMNTDHSYLTRIREELSDLTENMDVSFSSNRYLEFNRKGVNKGEGLKRLASILGVPIEETMAIGDNFNDLPMIKAAGLGVGVANSAEGIKADCGYITKADCDHSAVAEAINKFVLN